MQASGHIQSPTGLQGWGMQITALLSEAAAVASAEDAVFAAAGRPTAGSDFVLNER